MARDGDRSRVCRNHSLLPAARPPARATTVVGVRLAENNGSKCLSRSSRSNSYMRRSEATGHDAHSSAIRRIDSKYCYRIRCGQTHSAKQKAIYTQGRAKIWRQATVMVKVSMV